MALTRLVEAAGTLKARIARKRATARAVMVVERLWLLALPAAALAGLFVALSWFGYFRMAPDWLRIATLFAFAAGFVASLYPLSRLRLPKTAEIDRRLEAGNRIGHQAITAQNDRLETDTPFSRALWEEHQKRMASAISSINVGLPKPDTPRRDPFGLRALVVLILVTAFSFSYSNQAGMLSDAFVSHAVSNAPETRIDAWVTPPDYTRRAPIFLTAQDFAAERSIDIPQGSQVVVRVSGGVGDEGVSFSPEGTDASAILEAGDPASGTAAPAGAQTAVAATPGAGQDARSYSMVAEKSGTLAITGAREGDRQWRFGVIADTPPTIEFAREPRRAANGALEIAFTGEDDYGIENARAVIEPLEEPAAGARPLYGAPEYRLNLSRRGARVAEGRASHDLSDHPFAGMPVSVTLVATDAAGQEGRSEPREFVMPARGFSEPLARAMVEHRRIMALDANDVPRVIALNDALTTAPEETIDSLTHFLLLKSARSRILQAYDDDLLREAADYLWEIALGIEDGDLSLAERRLRDAQRELAEALENDATDEEIQALMDELRQAMQDYLQALAREMQNSDQAMQMPEGALDNLLRQQDLENMLDQIENLARQGARDEAQQMLSELQRMMNNLQAGRQQQQPGDSQMHQQMDRLGELMQEQQRLMNETFQLNQALRDRMQRGDPGQPPLQEPQDGQEEGEQGQGPDGMTAEELQEALRQLRAQQEALQEQLSELTEELEGMGIEPGEGFGNAGEAMGDAARSLGDGRGEQAVGDQGRALEALRQGAQDMMNQMQAMGQGEGEGGMMGPQQMRRSDSDPLGRPRSTEGPDFGDSVRVPDEIDIQRAREILDAIRNRLGNAMSPDFERRYLERLLDMR